MEADNWKAVTSRYFTPEELEQWAEQRKKLEPDYDPMAQMDRWRAFGARLEAALPLDPDSAEAEGFVREWLALLEPFARVATPEMWEGSRRMYSDMRSWEGEADPGFSARALAAVTEAATRMRAKGLDLKPLPGG